MMARNRNVPFKGRIQKRKTYRCQIITFGLQRAAGPRLHPNVLAAALANKLARIAWTVLAQERSYEARVTKAAA